MKIAVIGTGYVGLVTGACLADTGVTVFCVDNDSRKIEDLRSGQIPIFEPGLDSLVARTTASGRLNFTTSLHDALLDAEVAFIAVGTPPGDGGAADLSNVLEVADKIGLELARGVTPYLVVVTKSTVPVGTASKVRKAIQSSLDGSDSALTSGDFDVASNPEFLKEGAAIEDFAKPDRIVVGVNADRAKVVLERLYRPFVLNSHPVLFMDIPSAEITKYAANAMLATRISFMNQISLLCESVNADVGMVRRGIGADPRIGPLFLYAGAGYGGSCFPKDVRALASTMKEYGHSSGLLDEVEAINAAQKSRVFAKLCRYLDREIGVLGGITVAVWGLAFKPNTDDVREAPSLELIESVRAAGAMVRVYDPVASLPAEMSAVTVCATALDAVSGADALVLMTEWSEFRSPDFDLLAKTMAGTLIIDGRNVLSREAAFQAGFRLIGIGIGEKPERSAPH